MCPASNIILLQGMILGALLLGFSQNVCGIREMEVKMDLSHGMCAAALRPSIVQMLCNYSKPANMKSYPPSRHQSLKI